MDRWIKIPKHGGRMYDLPQKGVETGSRGPNTPMGPIGRWPHGVEKP